MQNLQQEMHALLLEGLKTDKPTKYKDLKKYIGTGYDFVGLSVPALRAIYKQGFSISKLPLKEQLAVWDEIWKTSGQYEMMSFALSFVSKHLSAFEPKEIWDLVKHWVKQVDNWAHSDGLSSIYAHLFEKEPELIYHQYQIWNTSANPWERRQSIVGMLYYSKLRKSHPAFEKLLSLVHALIHDDEYFVQKGIGWTLREMGNIYPAETLTFLTGHITAIKPVAFTAAMEKLDTATKERLKLLRKAGKKTKV